jgi:hypothetical protein
MISEKERMFIAMNNVKDLQEEQICARCGYIDYFGEFHIHE